MDLSLRELSKHLEGRPEFADVAAVRAVAPIRGEGPRRQITRIARRLGFELVPEADPRPTRRRLGHLGQNAVGLLLVLTSNPAAAHIDVLLRARAPPYISRRRLADRCRGAAL